MTSPNTKLNQETIRHLLIAAYLKTRKNKRSTVNTHNFEVNLLDRLNALAYKINNRIHELGASTGFVNHTPVDREIFAAQFEDRILHTLLVMIIEQFWDPRLDKNSFSCRKGKGTKNGVDTLKQDALSCSQNYTIPIAAIKLDFKKYFMSIIRKRLYERVLWGLDRQFPHKNDVYYLMRYLAHLIYLDEFDRFIRFELKIKYYGRYVDDSYILIPESERAAFLREKMPLIRAKAAEMGLELHPKKFYCQNFQKRGIEFIGARILPYRTLPGNRLKKNFKKAVFDVMMGRKGPETIQSYLGLLSHFDADNLIKQTFDQVGWDYPYGHLKTPACHPEHSSCHPERA